MAKGAKELAAYELIGLEAEVADSKNKSNIGVKGKIVDETRNTVTIENVGVRKVLLKSNITLKIMFKGQAIVIRGEMLSGKSKERIKK